MATEPKPFCPQPGEPKEPAETLASYITARNSENEILAKFLRDCGDALRTDHPADEKIRMIGEAYERTMDKFRRA